MQNCYISGCYSRNDAEYFEIPSLPPDETDPLKCRVIMLQQDLWLEAVHGKPIPQSNDYYKKKVELYKKDGRVCSKHFKSGKPADSFDVMNFDWIPHQFISFKALNKEKVAAIRKRLEFEIKEESAKKKYSPKKNKSTKSCTKLDELIASMPILQVKVVRLEEKQQPKSTTSVKKRKRSDTELIKPEESKKEPPKKQTKCDKSVSKTQNAVRPKPEKPKVHTRSQKVIEPTVDAVMILDSPEKDKSTSKIQKPIETIFIPDVDVEEEQEIPTLEKPHKLYKCKKPGCERIFDSLELAQQHIDTKEHKKEEKIPVLQIRKLHRCGICSKDFKSAEFVLEHIKVEHNSKITDPSQLSTTMETVNLDKPSLVPPSPQKPTVSLVSPVPLVTPPNSLSPQIKFLVKHHLMKKMDDFDWCQCRLCFIYYRLFLNHIDSTHKNKELGHRLFDKPTAPVDWMHPKADMLKKLIMQASERIESELQAMDDPKAVETNTKRIETNTEPIETTVIVDESNDEADDWLNDEAFPEAQIPEPEEDEGDKFDEYFDKEGNNWMDHPTDHVVMSSREATPEPEEKPPEWPTNVQNTDKKVYFAISKDKRGNKVYTCTLCKKNKDFTDYSMVLLHFNFHMKHFQQNKDILVNASITDIGNLETLNVVEYQCSLCDEIGSSKEMIIQCLETHRANGWIKTDDNMEDVAVIPKLENTYASQDLETANEVIIASDGNICDDDICGDIGVPQNLEIFTFQCEKCRKRLYSFCETYEHMKQVHGETYQLVQAEDVEVQHFVRCTACHLDFALSEISLAIAHRRSQHKFSVDYTNTNVKRYLIEPNGQESEIAEGNVYYKKKCCVDVYKCICSREYTDKNDVDTCFGKHTGLKLFKCEHEDCNRLFFSDLERQTHVSKFHEMSEALHILCELCGKSCLKKGLGYHLKTAHGFKSDKSIPKPTTTSKFQCSICDKSLMSKKGLRNHIEMIHKQTKRFSCNVCFKRYIYGSNAMTCQNRHPKTEKNEVK